MPYQRRSAALIPSHFAFRTGICPIPRRKSFPRPGRYKASRTSYNRRLVHRGKTVKRFAYIAILALSTFIFVPGASAQETPDHVNIGVFGNYVRLSDGDLNLAGVGGRLSVGVLPMVQLEAESSYQFDQAFATG